MLQYIKIQPEATVTGSSGELSTFTDLEKLGFAAEILASLLKCQFKVLYFQTRKTSGVIDISGYVRINVIHSTDIATPARVPTRRGQSQIKSSSNFLENRLIGLTSRSHMTLRGRWSSTSSKRQVLPPNF